MNLSDRINAVHKAHTGSKTTRGARAWFARTLKVSNRSVTRWCDGSQPFEGPPLSCLEILEKLATLFRGWEEMAARKDDGTIGGAFQASNYRARTADLRVP